MATTDHLGARADEPALLSGFLDWYRAVVERKVQDLAEDDAKRIMTPSGLSPLGVVAHLAWVERGWFQGRFAGEDVFLLYGEDGDNSAQFIVRPDDSVASVLAFYRREAQRSREIAAGAALDDLSVSEHPVYGRVSLRWVMAHMLEETARHAGHLDLMREMIDGRTGD